MYETLEQCE